LSAGAGLATLRADVNFVVTEYGIAQLKGKSIHQRVIELTQIAHPDSRAGLIVRSLYLRFFHNIQVFSHRMAQNHWANLDYRKNISLIGAVRNKGNKEIMALGTYAGIDAGQAEVAFLVHEDYQGMGVASSLLQELEKIALQNGYRVFIATVLAENRAMLHVFKKRYPEAKINKQGDEVEIKMDLAG
jgi:RimJ/RimL family protein N-acetyltransferase